MPVTVKDLVITTNISGNSREVNKAQQPAAAPMSKNDLEVVIKEAVRRVMEEIAYKKGR